MNKVWKSHPCHFCFKRHPEWQMLPMKMNNHILDWCCKKCNMEYGIPTE